MRRPYTNDPTGAFFAAQLALAATLTALVLALPLRTRLATGLLLLAFWTLLAAPALPELASSSGIAPSPTLVLDALRVGLVLGAVAFVLHAPLRIGVFAALGTGLAGWLTVVLAKASLEGDLSLAFTSWFGLLHGLATSGLAPDDGFRPLIAPMSRRRQLAIFACATLLAALVSTFVLHRFANSGDEWAYTYQADLLARLRAYGTVPPCPRVFLMYWVYFFDGRAVGQYTPGWPLAMAPFQAISVPWLAAPVAHGFLALGVARLATRVAKALPGATLRMVRIAELASVLALMGMSPLLNAGSRYPHTFQAAVLAWMLEALCVLVDARSGAAPDRARRERRWGLVLGTLASFLLTSRPAEGGLLGFGFAIVTLVLLLRRELAIAGLLWGALPFALFGLVSLLILRLQMGRWFVTGYALAGATHGAWADFHLSPPTHRDLPIAFPFAQGSYTWWPAAPALAAMGLFAARRGARHILWTLTLGGLFMAVFVAFVEYGRGENAGYGSRYHLPNIVPMALGTGLVVARVIGGGGNEPKRSARHLLTPAFLGGAAIAAVLLGWVRSAAYTFPLAYRETYERSSPLRAIDELKLKEGFVVMRDNAFDRMDLTQNFSDEKRLLKIIEPYPEELVCLRKHYGDLPIYLDHGRPISRIDPYPSR